jgi:antitoxin component YwqK of YwqJK toxin-antitoxin module
MTEYIKQYIPLECIPEDKLENDPSYFYLIEYEGLLVNKKKEGKWIEGYFDKNNQYCYQEINYVDNIKQGDYKVYYKNGYIKEKGFYNCGKLEGTYTIYWDYVEDEDEDELKNQNIMIIRNYINGILQGKYVRFDRHSLLYSKCYYINNKIEGIYSQYYYWPTREKLYINNKLQETNYHRGIIFYR